MPTETENTADADSALTDGLILEGGAFGDAMAFSDVKMPPKRNGIPCAYFWKESLTPGTFKDARGKRWSITPNDIADAKSDLDRSLLLGHEPPIVDDHFAPKKSFGFIKGGRINDHGGLELLHQFMGDDEKNEALRRKTSIMLRPDHEDAKGNRFKFFTDHSAIVFRPQLTDLKDYEPALAASGEAVNAVYLSLDNPIAGKTPEKEVPMDFAPLRATLGTKADGKPDTELLPLLLSSYTESAKTALALSSELDTTKATLKDQQEANDILAGELDAAEKKALALSAVEPEEPAKRDPTVDAMLADVADQQRELALSALGISDNAAKVFDELLKDAHGNPNVLALSAVGPKNRTFACEFWKRLPQLVSGMIPPNDPTNRGTPVQPKKELALSADEEKPPTEERIAELLAQAGIALAK